MGKERKRERESKIKKEREKGDKVQIRKYALRSFYLKSCSFLIYNTSSIQLWLFHGQELFKNHNNRQKDSQKYRQKDRQEDREKEKNDRKTDRNIGRYNQKRIEKRQIERYTSL